MPFRNHYDRLRAEVVLDVGGVISFWPRVDGIGNVSVDASPTYSLQQPDGTVLATGNATRTVIGVGTTVHRLDVTVSAANAAVLDEGYRCIFTWAVAASNVARTDLVLWDVVRFPFTGNPLTSLSDLQAIRPSVDERLERFGTILGFTTDEEMEAAMVFGHQARAELYAWIKAAAVTQQTTRPALILDRQPLAQIEAYLALAKVFEADAAGPGAIDDGGADDEASSLARWYRAQAMAMWQSIQPLDYDADEDGIADDQVRPGSSAIHTDRGGW